MVINDATDVPTSVVASVQCEAHPCKVLHLLYKNPVLFANTNTKLCILLGSDPVWALSDTKLSNEDLGLARRRAASEQKSETDTGRDL
jgi:hypothetical protein